MPDTTLTQDLIAVGAYPDDMPYEDAFSGHLGPFDPHMHASIVMSRRPQKGNRRAAGDRPRRKPMTAPQSQQAFPDIISKQPSFRRAAGKRKRTRGHRREAYEDNTVDDNDESSDEILSHTDSHRAAVAGDGRKRTHNAARTHRVTFATQDAGEFLAEAGPRRAPIADRMQAFLDANSSNVDICSGVEEPSSVHRNRAGNAPRRTQQRGRSSEQERPTFRFDSSPSDAVDVDDEPVMKSLKVLNDMVFQKLGTRTAVPPNRNSAPHPPTATLSDLCQTLLNSYPQATGECALMFESIVQCFGANSGLVRSDSVMVFTLVLKLLQLHGSMVLQGVIVARHNHLRTHVQLLTFILNLVKIKANDALIADDGAVFNLFGPKLAGRFVKMIVMQMVDSLYAQVLPGCWGLESPEGVAVVQALIPLRNALARLVPLVETVSRCIVKTFPCQEWREFPDGSGCFVSALDPNEYKAFLISGETPALSPSAGTYNLCKSHCIVSLFGSVPHSAIDDSQIL